MWHTFVALHMTGQRRYASGMQAFNRTSAVANEGKCRPWPKVALPNETGS